MIKTGGDTASVAYQHFLYQLIHRPRRNTHFGMSLALTSVNPGEGVTSVTAHFAKALQEISIRRVLQVNVAMLEYEVSLLNPSGANTTTAHVVPDAKTGSTDRASSGNNWQSRQACIRELSSHLDFLLVDCPALRQSGDILSVASSVDGIIVVVEAGKTTKKDIAFAEHQITASGGRIEGYVLNHKGSSLVSWLRQLLPQGKGGNV